MSPSGQGWASHLPIPSRLSPYPGVQLPTYAHSETFGYRPDAEIYIQLTSFGWHVRGGRSVSSQEGRLRTIVLARNTSPAGGPAEVDTLPGDVFLARGYAPPMISASGRSRVKSLGAKIPLECFCARRHSADQPGWTLNSDEVLIHIFKVTLSYPSSCRTLAL